MWDHVLENTIHISHDLPCLQCGHTAHSFLACDIDCACPGTPTPGQYDDASAGELLVLR